MFAGRDAFTQGMQHLASGVCVVTTTHEGKRWGLTATSVCSLAADPPLMIVCINKAGEAHEPIRSTGRLAINVLAQHQEDIALRFSGAEGHRGEARFADGTWTPLPSGAPGLIGGLAAFDCKVIATHECDTHTAFICGVTDVRSAREGTPLLYAHRAFARLAPSEDAA